MRAAAEHYFPRVLNPNGGAYILSSTDIYIYIYIYILYIYIYIYSFEKQEIYKLYSIINIFRLSDGFRGCPPGLNC